YPSLSMKPPPPSSTLFPYTTLFRSKPLVGFPQVMPNPLTNTGDSSRKEFELPVEKDLKKKIRETLLTQEQFLTHVDLIVEVLFRSEEHTSELQSRFDLVCRLLLEKK